MTKQISFISWTENDEENCRSLGQKIQDIIADHPLYGISNYAKLKSTSESKEFTNELYYFKNIDNDRYTVYSQIINHKTGKVFIVSINKHCCQKEVVNNIKIFNSNFPKLKPVIYS